MAKHVEISRFERKSDGYREAVKKYPSARCLELSITVSIIYALCNSNGWDKSDVRIADVMAGNGYLSSHLSDIGFSNVTAIEACDDMMPPAGVDRNFTTRNIETIDNIGHILSQIEPNIVVSLAGFHHLIRKKGNRVDRTSSIIWQYKTIELVMSNIPDDGKLVITDLSEPGAFSEVDNIPGGLWSKKGFEESMRELGVSPSIISERNKLQDLSKHVSEKCNSLSEKPSLDWFRRCVDRESDVGHDDVALSKHLIDLISMSPYNLYADYSFVPWLFDSISELEFYVVNKFGFNIEKTPTKKDKENIIERCKQLAGISQIDGKKAFGWKLGFVCISNNSYYDREIRIINYLIASINLLLLLTLLIKTLNIQSLYPFTEVMYNISYAISGACVSPFFKYIT